MKKGTLFYVVGASGAGKDSVMNGARAEMDGSVPVIFAHRYITRPADAGGENHVALSLAEFRMRQDKGLFAMAWESHGNHYGIGIEIDAWLSKGFGVVVNGSRDYLETAVRKYPHMEVILVSVSREILGKRLKERGRETPEEIEQRLQRSDRLAPVEFANTHTIQNDKTLEVSVNRFTELVEARLS